MIGSMRARCCLTFLVSLAFASCTCAPRLRTTRTLLTTVPPDFDARNFVASDDGSSHAYVARVGDFFHVVHDGTKGPPFREVTGPLIAPASRQVFYWGVDDDGGKPRVSLVAGQTTIVTALEKPGQIVFSADGGHWAAIGGTARRDGDRVARGPVILYRDGREVGSYADATVPALSRDGQHMAVLVENAGGQLALIVDGNEQRTFAPPKVATSPLVQPDQIGSSLPGMRVAYLADGSLMLLTRDESGWALYQREQRIASFKVNVSRDQGLAELSSGLQYARAISADAMGFAADAPLAVWWERLEGEAPRWHVVRDGARVDDVVCVKPWEHDPPVLSADGERVAYLCPKRSAQGIEQVSVVFDGRELGPYTGAWGIALSHDGRRVAYAADDNAVDRPWRYFVDGVPRPTRYDRVWPPRWSDDDRLFFWVAERGDRVVLMVNGSGRASSDSVVWVPKVSANGNLWWITQRGRRLSRVDVVRE